jgi:hypothetical protein
MDTAVARALIDAALDVGEQFGPNAEFAYRSAARRLAREAIRSLGGPDASDEAWDLAAFARYKTSSEYPGPVNRLLLPRLLAAAFSYAGVVGDE